MHCGGFRNRPRRFVTGSSAPGLRVRRPGLDLGHVALPSHRPVRIFAIAVIGEYVGKIYFETKARPRYGVEEEIGIVPAMP